VKNIKIIVEKHSDGYVAYPLGIQGVVVGEGDTYEEALNDVRSAILFHVETFGESVMSEVKDEILILHPETSVLPFWSTATPTERAERLMQLVQSHEQGANLPDEALRRDNIYD